MTIFDTSDISTTAQSSVPVTGGVQDNSGLAALDAVGKVANIAFKGYGNYKKAEADQALSNNRNSFADKQLSLAQAADRGDISSKEAKRRMRINARQALADGLDFADVKEIQAGITTTSGLGKVAAEGTEEEQTFNRLKTAAENDGFVMYGASPEKTAEGIEMHQLYNHSKAMMTQESSQLGLVAQRDSVATQIRVSKQKEAVKGLAVTQQYKLQEASNNILTDFRAGNLTEEQALILMENEFKPVLSTINQVAPETGSLIDTVSKPILDVKQYYTDMITGKITTDVGERAISNALQEQTILLTSDDDVAQKAALSKLFGHSAVAQLGIEKSVSAWLVNNTKATGGNKVSDPTTDTPEEKQTVQKGLEWLRKELNHSDQSVDPENHKRNMDQQVSSVLQGVFDYGGRVKNPKEFNEVVGFLSSPEFGEYATKNNIPSEVVQEAKEMLKVQYEDRVLPLIKDNYEQANISGYTSMGVSPKATKIVEPVFSGSGVRFKVKDGITLGGAAKASVDNLNRSVTPFLNRMIRMGAHLEGNTDYKKVYEENFKGVFGEELNDQVE